MEEIKRIYEEISKERLKRLSQQVAQKLNIAVDKVMVAKRGLNGFRYPRQPQLGLSSSSA